MLSLRRVAGLAASAVARGIHTLPKLPYSYDALSPVISADIMKLHYEKHHAAYVNNLNVAEAKLKEALAAGNVSAAAALEPAIRFNGGGHINHSIFWENLSPKGGGVAKGEIGEVILENFRSFDRFKELFTGVALGVQGSGWAWLGYNPATGRLRLVSCANQDPLQATTGMVPLLGIDVWEHAYYLQYKNARADYIKEIWNVINWADVESRLRTARMEN